MNAVHTGSGLKVLLVGPVPPEMPVSTNPMGGTSVNFAEMVKQLCERGFDVAVVDTTRPRLNLPHWRRWFNNIATVMRVVGQTALRLPRSQVVVLNISAGSAWTLGSCIWFFCATCRCPMALRLFGGDFARMYDRYGRLLRWWADHTFMRCDLVFVQTRELLNRFRQHVNFRWFANTRDLRPPSAEAPQAVSRLVFISQLRREKGLQETLEACRDLPTHCQLNVFGPPMPDTDMSLFDGSKAVYRGALNAHEVPGVLLQHDVLLLPTYWKSEGYPGIVLEALQCGRPVITTWWRCVPEVVEDGKSGLLVEPRSAPSVREAIHRLANDPDLYRTLCKGARERGEFFRSGPWYDQMAKELCTLVRNPEKRG
ncbi:MAG: glycosyltransferase family 4 protein [Spirochaetaceae bacterium]|nr:glycosyltransferase family 4 protein [Spirochaetaceae bacterium]